MSLPSAPWVHHKDERIAIIGGGPAGVHMASLLCKRGYSNVTILEASKAVGGKSSTVVDDRGIVHELGTCYLHALYDPIRSLLAEYTPENKEVPIGGGNTPKNFRVVFGNDLQGGSDYDYTRGQDFGGTRVITRSMRSAVPYEPHGAAVAPKPDNCWRTLDFVLAKSEEQHIAKPFWACFCDELQYLPIAVQMTRYIALHKQIFGDVRFAYGLPPRPKDWTPLDMSAMDFLKKNDLTSMLGLMRYVQQAQGYGVLETIPAFYMLWWVHPALIETLLVDVVKKERATISMLSQGWQTLWLAMAKKLADTHGLKVITEAYVTAVKRANGSTTVRYSTPSAGTVVGQFDKVIFAINLTALNGMLTDITAEEKEIFGELSTVTLATTLYEADAVSHEHAVEFWFSRMQPSEVDGRVYAHRNDRLALNPASAVPPGGRERRLAYQHINRPPTLADNAKLAAQLERDLIVSGEKGVKVLEQRVWSYLPHWKNNSLRKGRPWRVLEMQGERNSVFIGSSVCFESVLDVVAYNEMLATHLRF